MSAGDPSSSPPIVLDGGLIVTPGCEPSPGSLAIDGTEISAVGQKLPSAERQSIDVSGRLILPGFVDLHGDEIERLIEPKPEAEIDPNVALLTADRLNLSAGITTKFHALAFEESPEDNRSIRRANTLVDHVEDAEDLLGDHRAHARCEVGDATAFEAVAEVVDKPVVDLVSIMNHLPGNGQHDDFAAVNRDYRGDFWGEEDVRSVIQSRQSALMPEVRKRIASLIELAERSGIPVAAHDLGDPDVIDRVADLGITISEYPTTLSAAKRAAKSGLTVAMGAPNLVRGGSLWGNLSTKQAIESGSVDVLCSDFHPASLLSALFVETGEPIQRRVARVTSEPAKTVGLQDRGRLEAGYRADVIVVNPGDPPRVERVFVRGSEVLRTTSGAECSE